LYDLQKKGLNVLLCIGEHLKEVNAYFPVAMIIGDAKSNDALTCRVPHYEQPRMSRACYTSFEDCCNPDHKCKWVTREQQEKLSERSANPDSAKDKVFLAKLKSVSTVRCQSSLFQMDFGSNPYGQFRACTVDPMHLFEGGWCASVAKAFVRPLRTRIRFELDVLLERIRQSSRSSVRDRFPRINFSGGVTSMTQIASHEWPGVLLAYLIAIQMPQGRKLLSTRLEDDDKKYNNKVTQANQKAKRIKLRERVLKKNNLLSTKERMAMQKRQRKNADADSSSSEESAEEDSLSDCDDAFIITSKEEARRFGNQTRCTLESIVQLFEMILCFHSFYKNSTYWKIGDRSAYKRFDQAIRILMKQLVTTLHRGEKTNNWNTQKTHEILHFPYQIIEYGHLMNADTGVGERGLKDWAKKAARRALKGSVDVFTESTARQVIDTMVLRKASEVMDVGHHMYICTRSHERSQPSLNTDSTLRDGFLVGDAKFKISGRLVDNMIETTCVWFGSTAKKHTTGVPERTIELFEEEFLFGPDNLHRLESIGTCTILGFTEYRLPNGQIVRAHPNYRSEGPFYDWCVIPDPNQGKDYAVRHLDSKRPLPEHLRRSEMLSRVEEKWGINHVPCRVLAFFKHPETATAMALVLPCRPWMNMNEKKTSTITEHWNVQCELRPFVRDEDGKLQEVECNTDKNGRQSLPRGTEWFYVPMYHMVPASTIKEVVFAIQENGPFADCWGKDGGNAIIVSDRVTTWGDCFEDFVNV
jgi:hypothetical protein